MSQEASVTLSSTNYTESNNASMATVDDVTGSLFNLSVNADNKTNDNSNVEQKIVPENAEQGEVKLTKKERKKLTMYWGIELENDVFNDFQIKSFLDEHPDLIKLEKIHSTLLFVGKKINKDEEVISPFAGKVCELVIDAYGYSDDALALRVKSIMTDNEVVPSFAIQQHVTMALKKGIFAKDSVKTLLGEGTIETLAEPIILTGKVKRYMF